MLLLALAVAGLVGVFVLVANYVSDVETEVGDKIFVLELTKPATANEAISDDMVTLKQVPKRWAPGAALQDRTQLVGVVAAANLQRNSILQEGML
ncbi:MAG TPA: SAF domain-containing protein, partial [Solirubrobacter sp.]